MRMNSIRYISIKRFRNNQYYLLIILGLFLLYSCTKVFDFSPYDVPTLSNDEKDLTEKNIKKIVNINLFDADSFCYHRVHYSLYSLILSIK